MIICMYLHPKNLHKKSLTILLYQSILSWNFNGYLKNPEATSLAIDNEGWLRTGNLCYIDPRGFVYVVDRIKGLIKYKAYQVNLWLHACVCVCLFAFLEVDHKCWYTLKLQVAPAELEGILSTHPDINDVAVTSWVKKIDYIYYAYCFFQFCSKRTRKCTLTLKSEHERRYPDEEAGEIPMACVVRTLGNKIREEDIISFMENKVIILFAFEISWELTYSKKQLLSPSNTQ